MESKWLEEIERGRYATNIAPLTLSGNFGKFLRGAGRLSWTPHDIDLDATTDGGDAVVNEMLIDRPCAPGEMFPNEYYLELAGKCGDNWDVTVQRLAPECFSAGTDGRLVTWSFAASHFHSWIRFRNQKHLSTSDANFRCEAVIKGFEIPEWPRSSTTTYDNPRFGKTETQNDWLEFALKRDRVAVQNRGNDLIRVIITGVDELDPSGLVAIVLALSYLNGHMVHLLGYESHGGEHQTRVLPTTRHRLCRNRFPNPFGTCHRLKGCYEPFLERMSELFLTLEGTKIANLLYGCMGAVDNTFTTNAMAQCMTLEALIKPYTRPTSKKVLLTQQHVDNVVSLLRNERIDEEALNRVPGLLSMLNRTSVKALLRDWSKRGILGVEEDDISAWEKLRHPAMHGNLLLEDDDMTKQDAMVTSLHRVSNLINKLVLNRAGYSGKYFDYAKWRESDFTPH